MSDVEGTNTLGAALVAGLCALLACSCGGRELSACTPGRVETCPCSGGRSGTQACLADGTFGACVCDEPMDAGLSDAAVDDAAVPDDASSSDADVDAAAMDAGPLPGHAILIGHDGYFPNDSVDRMIANAVFVGERPATGALRILEMALGSTAGSEANIHAAIDAGGTSRGRVVTYTNLASTMVSALESALADADVFLVRPLDFGGAADYRTLAPTWHDSIVAFLDAGGVVVVLMNIDASSGRRHEEWLVLSGTDLFNGVTDVFPTGPTTFEVVGPTDAVGMGVLSPYAASGICLNMVGGGVPITRTAMASISPALCPVVRHLVH